MDVTPQSARSLPRKHTARDPNSKDGEPTKPVKSHSHKNSDPGDADQKPEKTKSPRDRDNINGRTKTSSVGTKATNPSDQPTSPPVKAPLIKLEPLPDLGPPRRKGQASKRNTTAIPRGFVVDGTNHTSKRQRHSMRNIETVNKDNHIPQVDFVLTSKRQSRTQRKSVVDVHNQLNTDSFRSAKPSQRMTTLLGKNLKLNVLSKKDEISQRCTTARRLPKIFISAHTGKFDEVYEILCPGGQLLVAAELQKVITQTSSDGTTVLHHSVVGGQIKIVEFLIQCKADLQASDVEDLTPAHFATYFKHLDILKLFLSNGVNPMMVNGVAPSLLDQAVLSNDRETIKLLIKSSKHKIDCVAEPRRGFNLIHFASQLGKKSSLSCLLGFSIFKSHINDRTRNQSTAAHLAAANDRTSCLSELIKRGANVNLKDNEGFTPLHCALFKSRRRTSKLLLESKLIDFDAVDNQGRTALHLAVEKKLDTETTFLLESNASLALQTKDLSSPLHIAIRAGNNTIIDLIIDKLVKEKTIGQLLLLKDKEGRSPLTQAALSSNNRLTSMLIKLGACPSPLYERPDLQAFRDTHKLTIIHPADQVDYFGFVKSHEQYLKLILVDLPQVDPTKDEKSFDKCLAAIEDVIKESKEADIGPAVMQKLGPLLKKLKKKVTKHSLSTRTRPAVWRLLLVQLAFRSETREPKTLQPIETETNPTSTTPTENPQPSTAPASPEKDVPTPKRGGKKSLDTPTKDKHSKPDVRENIKNKPDKDSKDKNNKSHDTPTKDKNHKDRTKDSDTRTKDSNGKGEKGNKDGGKDGGKERGKDSKDSKNKQSDGGAAGKRATHHGGGDLKPSKKQTGEKDHKDKHKDHKQTDPKGKKELENSKTQRKGEKKSLTGQDLNLSSTNGVALRGRKYLDGPLSYASLLSVDLLVKDSFQMHLDIDRTLRCHTLFESKFGEMQCKLYRILHAFVIFDSKTVNQYDGYVQGMATIAALLLLVLGGDEESTWIAMLTLFSVYSIDSLYRHSFIEMQPLCDKWDNLLSVYFPEVKEKFTTANIFHMTYLPNWLLGLFYSIVPFSLMLRIWDFVLLDGFSVLFSFSLAFIDINEDIILSTEDFGSLTHILKYSPSGPVEMSDKIIHLALTKYANTEVKPPEEKKHKDK